MTILIVFVAAAPFRAVLQLADGSRMLVRGLDPTGDDSVLYPAVFIDELGVEIGLRAQFLSRTRIGAVWYAGASGLSKAVVDNVADGAPWLGRDLFALLLRRFIIAAERGANLEIGRLMMIVPPGLDDADQASMIIAGHIAGCAQVELAGVGDLLVAGFNAEVGQRHLLIHFDADQLRVSLFKSGAIGAVAVVNKDLSASWSGDRLIDRVSERLSADDINMLKLRNFLSTSLPLWNDQTSAETLLESRFGTPDALYLPATARTQLAEEIVEQVRAVLTLESVSWTQINWVHLHGSWATGLAARFERLAPAARVQFASSSSATLELANPPPQSRATMQSTLFADRPTGDRVSPGETARVSLVHSGKTLPATFFEESFSTQHYFDSVGLFAVSDKHTEAVEIAKFPLPRLFERRAFSRFQIKVVADTDQYIVLMVSIAIKSKVYLFVYDKKTEIYENIDLRVLELLEIYEF